MATMELTSSGDGNEINNVVSDDVPKIKTASLRMLEIAEKLESINQQRHILTVENKVLHQAHDGGPDLNTFLMRANSSSPNSSKRRSNFLIPSIAGTSKSVSNKKVFSNLTPTQQFEALHQVANEQSDVVLNFEGLRKSIQASHMSIALKKAIGLNKSSEDDTANESDLTVSKEKDEEELTFVKDLLEEQNDLNEKIMAVEKDRLDSTVDLLYSKMEVAKEFLVTKQIYKDIISSDSQSLEDDDEDMEDEDAENIDNANSDADDEEKQLQKKIRKEKKKLAREEARLNQMKFLVQKLMASCPNNAMTFDEETNEKHYDMFLKCGQQIPEMRGDEDQVPDE